MKTVTGLDAFFTSVSSDYIAPGGPLLKEEVIITNSTEITSEARLFNSDQTASKKRGLDLSYIESNEADDCVQVNKRLKATADIETDQIPSLNVKVAETDAYVGELQTGLATTQAGVSTNVAAISAETARASGVESTNAAAISAEVARASNAESINAGAITAEATRASAAEAINSAAISTETTRASAAEAGNATDIAAEATRAFAAEASNATAITAEATRASAAEASNTTAISTEATRASAAEASNTAAISAEATRASAAEAANAGNIAAETTRASAAEASNTAAIAAETTRASAAEASNATDIATLTTTSNSNGSRTQNLSAVAGESTFTGTLTRNTDSNLPSTTTVLTKFTKNDGGTVATTGLTLGSYGVSLVDGGDIMLETGGGAKQLLIDSLASEVRLKGLALKVPGTTTSANVHVEDGILAFKDTSAVSKQTTSGTTQFESGAGVVAGVAGVLNGDYTVSMSHPGGVILATDSGAKRLVLDGAAAAIRTEGVDLRVGQEPPPELVFPDEYTIEPTVPITADSSAAGSAWVPAPAPYACSSSSYDFPYYAFHVFDHNNSTHWEPNGVGFQVGEWLNIDLGQNKTIAGYRVMSNSYQPKSWRVFVRPDRVDGVIQEWILADTQVDRPQPPGFEHVVYQFANTVIGRDLKIEIDDVINSGGVRINELSVLTAPATAADQATPAALLVNGVVQDTTRSCLATTHWAGAHPMTLVGGTFVPASPGQPPTSSVFRNVALEGAAGLKISDPGFYQINSSFSYSCVTNGDSQVTGAITKNGNTYMCSQSNFSNKSGETYSVSCSSVAQLVEGDVVSASIMCDVDRNITLSDSCMSLNKLNENQY